MSRKKLKKRVRHLEADMLRAEASIADLHRRIWSKYTPLRLEIEQLKDAIGELAARAKEPR